MLFATVGELRKLPRVLSCPDGGTQPPVSHSFKFENTVLRYCKYRVFTNCGHSANSVVRSDPSFDNRRSRAAALSLATTILLARDLPLETLPLELEPETDSDDDPVFRGFVSNGPNTFGSVTQAPPGEI